MVVQIERLSALPERREAARVLLGEYLRLADGWAHEPGGVPIALPAVLAQVLATFPGGATPPTGETFIAVDGIATVGVVMLERYDSQTAHVQRLYVSPRARRLGIGKRLTIACIQTAATLGCSRLALDVLPSRAPAVALYEGLGFYETSPWTSYPMPMRFLARSTG